MFMETPCIVIDMDKVEQNLKRMADICHSTGCHLRPHIKTHKIPELAKLQLEHGAVGITVAKLSEAEVMARYGICDIFMAYPLIGESQIQRAIMLSKSIRFICATDCYKSAEKISQACIKAGVTLELRMEIDTGMHRTGIPYEKALDEAERISSLPGITLQGIFTFRGMIYDGKTELDREKCGIQEGQIMASLAEEMRLRKIPIHDVSVGSTPTGEFCASVDGVTEIRPGTYVFQDMMQVNTHACSCTIDNVAAVILSQVISTCKPEVAVIDCGCKSISTDVPLGKYPYNLSGYGTIIDHPELVFDRLSEEHGMLSSADPIQHLQTGEILRIIPNHICPTINLYDHVYIMRNGKVCGRYNVAARGMNY